MKSKFIPTNNDLSYYPLLYKALEATKGYVIEMGCGHGSTPLLHEYCKRKKRKLFSYESNKEWYDKFKHMAGPNHIIELVTNWDTVSTHNHNPSVVFIDHAPGERRKKDISLFSDKAEIIVIHDTEPFGAGDYQVRPLFKNFKTAVEVQSNYHPPTEAGAWATAVSNKMYLSGWAGEQFGNYKISPLWKQQ